MVTNLSGTVSTVRSLFEVAGFVSLDSDLILQQRADAVPLGNESGRAPAGRSAADCRWRYCPMLLGRVLNSYFGYLMTWLRGNRPISCAVDAENESAKKRVYPVPRSI